jgi:hypothetical protein
VAFNYGEQATPGSRLYEAIQRESDTLNAWEKIQLAAAWRGKWPWAQVSERIRERFEAAAREVKNGRP